MKRCPITPSAWLHASLKSGGPGWGAAHALCKSSVILTSLSNEIKLPTIPERRVNSDPEMIRNNLGCQTQVVPNSPTLKSSRTEHIFSLRNNGKSNNWL